MINECLTKLLIYLIKLYMEALEIKRNEKVNSVWVAYLLNSIGYVYYRLGDLEKAVSMHEEELLIQRCLLPSDSVQLASVLGNLAFVYQEKGDLKRTQELHDEAARISRESTKK